LRAGQPVVTYVARNLEPHRGFHSFMRALPAILAGHPQAQVVVVGGDQSSYSPRPKDAPNWRNKLLSEVEIDARRVHFLGKVPYSVHRKVLQISAAHVYLTYPFVLSWSLLEAMATGCAIVGSDTAPVREVIRDGINGHLVDFFAPDAIAAQVLALLAAPQKQTGLRKEARLTAQRYSVSNGLRAYHQLLADAMALSAPTPA
ncbi:glycosyltransferase, partial [Pseudomonas aeruginosa]